MRLIRAFLFSLFRSRVEWTAAERFLFLESFPSRQMSLRFICGRDPLWCGSALNHETAAAAAAASWALPAFALFFVLLWCRDFFIVSFFFLYFIKRLEAQVYWPIEREQRTETPWQGCERWEQREKNCVSRTTISSDETSIHHHFRMLRSIESLQFFFVLVVEPRSRVLHHHYESIVDQIGILNYWFE